MALKDDNFFVIQGWMINKLDINNKELLEKALYCKDSFKNIRNRISKNKVEIKELYGRTNNKI